MAGCPKTAVEAWMRLDKRLSEEEKKAIREAGASGVRGGGIHLNGNN